MSRLLFLLLVQSFCLNAFAQDSTDGKLDLSGYAEAYYQYDFGRPPSGERSAFLYNHKRHNEMNINLAYLKAAYSSKKIRGNIALMTGNYPQYNLAAEPQLMQQVLELNIGYSFSDKWSMDLGILPSHIGMESAVSKDCWTLSRSLVAENSPYYETGLKLNFSPDERWSLALLLLNGWQNIRETNSAKAWGTQVQFRPNKKWVINSSSFIGNEQADSVSAKMRFFHDLFITRQLSDKLNIAVLFDIGTEKSNTWYGSAILLQYQFQPKWKIGFRAEQYKDRQGVILGSSLPVGVGLSGASLNTDFSPLKKIMFRAEARYLHADRSIFLQDGTPAKNNLSMMGSVAISF